MSYVRTLGPVDGYDEDRSLLVLSQNASATLHYVDDSVLGLYITPDKEGIVQIKEMDETKAMAKNKAITGGTFGTRTEDLAIKKLTIKGIGLGTTTLRNTGVGANQDGMRPILVRVVANSNSRQAAGKVDADFLWELKQMDLREAVLRVAEDQMNSSIGHSSAGRGAYTDPSYDWCGAFCYYCWSIACQAHRVENPFGKSVSSLLSCQKAISYALQHPNSSTILRYEGGDPYGNSFVTGQALPASQQRRQQYIEIDEGANRLLPGDIEILRNPTIGWQHVALVESRNGDNLNSINGNPRIWRETRKMSAKVNGKDYASVFLHVKV